MVDGSNHNKSPKKKDKKSKSHHKRHHHEKDRSGKSSRKKKYDKTYNTQCVELDEKDNITFEKSPRKK